jgi:integrase
MCCTARCELRNRSRNSPTASWWLGRRSRTLVFARLRFRRRSFPRLRCTFASFVGVGPDEMLFSNLAGGPLRRATFYTVWGRASKRVGITGLRFHDLRHTGNTLAAMTGASTKELMSRMGQSSPRAALIYQHATKERDVAIANGLISLIEAQRPDPTPPPPVVPIGSTRSTAERGKRNS